MWAPSACLSNVHAEPTTRVFRRRNHNSQSGQRAVQEGPTMQHPARAASFSPVQDLRCEFREGHWTSRIKPDRAREHHGLTATAGAWQEVTTPPARGLPRPGWITFTSTTPSVTADAVHAA